MAEQYQLPNGKYINVSEDFVGSQEETDLLREYNKREQSQQAEQSYQPTPSNSLPEGKENNWLYDTAVVAPLEGGRKFVNSSGRLIEHLGDTLGEATGINLTGDSKVKEFKGFKGFFHDEANPENDNHTTSMVGSFVESGVQFLLGYGVAGKVLQKVAGAGMATAPLTTAQRISQTTTQGAIGDFIAFDENSGRFADVVTEFAPDFGNTFLSYLQSNKEDTWYEGRLKNSIEGVGLGLMAEVLFKVAKVSKNKLSGSYDETSLKADEVVITKAQEAIIDAKPRLDEATTIGEKMKIVNDALENVDGLKPQLRNITKENKVEFLSKLAKEDLEINYNKYMSGELSAEEAFSIPRAWINLDTLDKNLISKDFVKSQLDIIDLVKSTYKQVDKKFTAEVVELKGIREYGGNFNKMYKDFSTVTDTFKDIDVSPLIAQHEGYLRSLIDNIPKLTREVKLGLRPEKDIDSHLAIIASMQNNSKFLSSELGGGLYTKGRTTQEFIKSNVIEENLRKALGDFENFGTKDIKAKKELLDKLALLDNPTVTSKVLSYVNTNKTWDVLNEVWINALLSNPKTLGVNALGNAVTAVARPFEDVMGSKISAWLSGSNLEKKAVYEAQIREAKSTFVGLFSYLREASKYAGLALKNGDTILDNVVKIDTANTRATGTGVIGNLVRIPSRILNATDELFKQANYRAKLGSLAVQAADAKGLKGKNFEEFVTEYIRQGFDEKGLRGTNLEALKYAQENTFTNELTGISKKFQEAVQSYPFLKQFFPFVRTPFQLAKAISDRSLGAVTYNLEHLLGKSGDPKMIAKVRGQAAMGGILLSSATALYQLGMISGATNQKGDGMALNKFDDAELLRMKKSDTNFKPYSFNVGGTQIQFGRLDPYGAFFGLMADFFTIKDKLTQDEIERIGADYNLFLMNQMSSDPISGWDKAAIIGQAGFGAIKENILNKTYFQAIHDIVDAVYDQDPNRVKKYFTTKFGSFVPNIVTKINNDPYLRDAQGFIDEIFRKRLGVGTPPSPKYNFMGEAHTMGDEDSIQRFFNNFANPLAVGGKTDDILTKEILRLGKAPEVLNKFQDKVDYTQYKFGKLTAYDRLNQILNSTAKIEGMSLREKLSQEIDSESYKSLGTDGDPIKIAQGSSDDGAKYTRLNRIYNQYKIKAEVLFEAEKAKYLSIDNPDRNLFKDTTKAKSNDRVIKEKNRNLNKLQPIINFYEQ